MGIAGLCYLTVYAVVHKESPFVSWAQFLFSRSPGSRVVQWWIAGLSVFLFLGGLVRSFSSGSGYEMSLECGSEQPNRFYCTIDPCLCCSLGNGHRMWIDAAWTRIACAFPHRCFLLGGRIPCVPPSPLPSTYSTTLQSLFAHPWRHLSFSSCQLSSICSFRSHSHPINHTSLGRCILSTLHRSLRGIPNSTHSDPQYWNEDDHHSL